MKGISKKTIIILIVVILISIGVFFYLSGEPSEESTSSLQAEESPEAAASLASAAKILSLLNQVNSIHIDLKFFESSVYNSLVDYTVVVPEQNVGRENPFIPVPGTFASPPKKN